MINHYELKMFLANTGLANRILNLDELDLDELGISSQNPDGPYYISYDFEFIFIEKIITDDIIKKFLRSKKLDSL